jgi:hypothetical protein
MDHWTYGRLDAFVGEVYEAAGFLLSRVRDRDRETVDLRAVDAAVRRLEHPLKSAKALLRRERRSKA